nr:glycosyltransferase [Chitinophaga sp. Cy-1792]
MTKVSPLLKDKPQYHIPNPLDTDIYTPKDKQASRAALGLTENIPAISFVSERLFNSEFKGGKELLQVLSLLDEQLTSDVYLLMIGRDTLPVTYKHLKPVYTGYVQGMERMMQCYGASDIFIYPTKADTLPNVLIEAGSCATTCVTFDVGGCAEIVKDGHTGYVVAPGDYQQFAQRVLGLLQDNNSNRQFGENARNYIIQHFGMKTVAEQYYKVFSDVRRHP